MEFCVIEMEVFYFPLIPVSFMCSRRVFSRYEGPYLRCCERCMGPDLSGSAAYSISESYFIILANLFLGAIIWYFKLVFALEHAT